MIVRPVQPVTEFTLTVGLSEMKVLWAVLGHAKAEMGVDHMYKAIYDQLVAHGHLPTGAESEKIVKAVTFERNR